MKIAPFSRFTVHGNSMFPTLKPGQDILSFNWAYLFSKPKIGDIIIIQNSKFKVQSSKFKKRNEIVKRIQKIDGRHVFVTGDNLQESTDSRHFGPIRMDQIIGKVIFP